MAEKTKLGSGKITKVSYLPISAIEKAALKQIENRFQVKVPEHYANELMQQKDGGDRVRRIVIPTTDELDGSGKTDPSNEALYTIMPGLEHKYDETVLLLVSGICEGICRYCFRKAVVNDDAQKRVLKNVPAAVRYINNQPQVTNVILSGGDPFSLPTERLEEIVAKMSEIPHVRVIRIGTKATAYNPWRILDDPQNIAEKLGKYAKKKTIAIVNHFDVPNEITQYSREAVSLLKRYVQIMVNQTPLTAGINDDPSVLAELQRAVLDMGVFPYYVFQMRPAQGNKHFAVPFVRGYEIVQGAKNQLEGLAKKWVYVMSHELGKMEIVNVTNSGIYMKFHRAHNPKYNDQMMSFPRTPQTNEAKWLEGLMMPGKKIEDYFIDDPKTLKQIRLYGRTG